MVGAIDQEFRAAELSEGWDRGTSIGSGSTDC